MTTGPFVTEMDQPPDRPATLPAALFPLEGAAAVAVEEPEIAAPPPPALPPGRSNPGRVGIRLLGAALLGLLGLAGALAVERLVADLLADPGWLGAMALVLVALGGAGTALWVGWEIVALRRLGQVDAMRSLARAAAGGDAKAADQVVAAYRRLHPDGVARVSDAMADRVDTEDVVPLLEIHVQRDIDARSRAVITATAKRTAMVTAISPFVLLDLAATAGLNIRMVRRISEIQGNRPGFLATLSLLRRVAASLILAGGVEALDQQIGDFLGAGLLRSLGRRAGEGLVNGMMTVRIGVAATKQCRPLPYLRDAPPTVLATAREVFGTAAKPPG
jgi:putative membrane protein